MFRRHHPESINYPPDRVLLRFGGAVVGMSFATLFPSDSSVARLGVGLIAKTMSALVLDLPVSIANGSYNTKRAQLSQAAADFILVDRLSLSMAPERTYGLRDPIGDWIDHVYHTRKYD